MLSRDNQHAAITSLIYSNSEMDRWTSGGLASILLDNGVTYEVPPKPEPLEVGTTVSDDQGTVWTRLAYETDTPWIVISNNSGHCVSWSEILEYTKEEVFEINVITTKN